MNLPSSKLISDPRTESEEHYRLLVENLGEGVAYVDPNEIFTFANPAAESILGVGPGELVGRCLLDFLAAEVHPLIHKEAALRRTNVKSRYEHEIVRPDGTRRTVEVTATPQFRRDGRFLGTFAVLWDMTDRKEVEEALRASEKRNRMLARALQSAGECISITDTEDRLLYVNDAFLQTYGYREHELIGQHIGILRSPRTRREIQDEILPATIAGRWSGELWNRTKQGREFIISLATSVVYDESGQEIALVGVAGDITERKQAEDALRDREALLNASGELAKIGGWKLNLDTNELTWTREVYRIHEVDDDFVPTVEKAIGFYVPESRRVIQQAVERAIESGEPFDVELQILTAKNNRLWVHAIGKLQKRQGETTFVSGTFQDITARRRAEEERDHLQLQLAQAQKMESVGRLAGGVAHDFNNLLTVINGYSQMVLEKLSPRDPLRDTIEEIYKAGERAAGLTRQLLAFSRKQVLEPRKLDVNRLVEEMRPMLERLVGEAIEVRVALCAGSGEIHADPHQLEQVVMNLVVNARDAMPGIGKLLVETANVERDDSYVRAHPEARVGRYVMLAVSDTGTGMDEETRKRIFEPFFTTKGVGKGTGLGLSMVQGIVAQSGGYIEVYSEEGKGTSFKIYLPALAAAAPDGGRPVAVPVMGGKETVLVVEDQAEVRHYTVAALKKYGYEVIPAGSAAEALRVCGQERVDLVLTDVVMPLVSGRELARRLESLHLDIKVLYMSGYTDNIIEHHGVLEQGANFIQKPFSPEEVARKVRAVLAPPARKCRFLVVDDEAGVRGFLRRALEEHGHEVIEAEDGKQALTQVLAGHVDLVITDLVMPGQEGLETIQALRREAPEVGIIAISGAFGGQFLETAQMLGASAVLNKPVTSEMLLARVAEVLNRGL